MKARILTLSGVFLALASVSLAQTHHKNDHTWTKHPVAKTRTIRHRGGMQTVTTYKTAQQKHDAKYARYSKSEWERRIREARERRKHKKGSSWYKKVTSHKHTVQKHPKSWYTAVKHRKPAPRKHPKSWYEATKHRMHRGPGHETVWTTRRHDNGKHLGWYKGKGNPHRTGMWQGKGHDKDDHKHKGHDKDDHKGKGHGH